MERNKSKKQNLYYSFILLSLQPFKASTKPSRRTVLGLIVMTWAVSLFLALFPFTTRLQYVFTNRAIIPGNLFFENVIVGFDSAKDWAEKLLTFSPELQSASSKIVFQIRDATSWSELQSTLGNVSVASVLDAQSFIG